MNENEFRRRFEQAIVDYERASADLFEALDKAKDANERRIAAYQVIRLAIPKERA